MGARDWATKAALEAAVKAGRAAMEKAAKNEEVQKAAIAASSWAAKSGADKILSRGRSRRRALALARQINGQYTRGTIVANRERWVVWKGEKAIACFPPLTPEQLDGKELFEREELQGFNLDLLRDPPRDS